MQSKTRRKNSKKCWNGRVLQKFVALVEPMPIASVHPMVVGWSDALVLDASLSTFEDQVKIMWGTGWTDGITSGIGALGILCSRDDVKCPREDPSAPVQPTEHRSKVSEQWRQQKRRVQQLDQLLCVTGWTDALSIGLTDGPWSTATVSEANGYFSCLEWPDEPTLPLQEASVHPMIRSFSADHWSNGYKTWWPIYTPHPGHLKFTGVARSHTHT